ncbi:MAG: hypothetical protein JWP31_588 [Aeromicrobium sp.]|nr:hypothetical protein [Aeromicrobium sp.]
MTLLLGIVIGVVAVVLLRLAFARALLVKLRRDVAALNAGDHRPLLSGYARDAVLEFNDTVPRWAGDGGRHVGRDAIGTFLADFVRYGIKGEILELWTGGWPWAPTILVRFDDHASDDTGAQVYANRTVLLCRTRWGRIVRQEDYYYDTVRMRTFDENLTARGM